MKKTFILFVFLLILSPLQANAALADDLSGKILLQVEDKGQAWYVNPENLKRYYMGRPTDAYSLMRELGLGISNADIRKIPVAILETYGPDRDGDRLPDAMEDSFGTSNTSNDTDGDFYWDEVEIKNHFDPLGPGVLPIDNVLINRLSGRILLQVERHGEAWYLNPDDNKRYYLGRPDDAFQIMRNLGLGITNVDLSSISIDYKWARFTHKGLGYLVYYPNFLDLTMETTPGAERTVFNGPIFKTQNWPLIIVSYNTRDIEPGTDIIQRRKDALNDYLLKPGESAEIKEDRQIAGFKTAHVILYDSFGNSRTDEYHFIKDNKEYSIIIVHGDGKKDWDMYNKFLDSYQFVQSSGVVWQQDYYFIGLTYSYPQYWNKEPSGEDLIIKTDNFYGGPDSVIGSSFILREPFVPGPYLQTIEDVKDSIENNVKPMYDAGTVKIEQIGANKFVIYKFNGFDQAVLFDENSRIYFGIEFVTEDVEGNHNLFIDFLRRITIN